MTNLNFLLNKGKRKCTNNNKPWNENDYDELW